ncbi:MAG TPA: ethanolamine ammonia-lyase subunit EutC [Bryobacteraceae bacterium]|nr:ethanolamine ammonia-lyase subunit EutC [Bryobacteraceae bacterium]
MVVENPWTGLRELTAARIALGRCGHSLPTRELLAFQLAHARARDAVYHSLDVSSLALHPAVVLKSAAPDRATYLRRPDLGRLLAQESVQRLTAGDWDAVLVVADGLSATAVHRHAAALIDALMPRLEGWRIAPICIVEQGRVAIGDDIGERMGARLAVVLIGERPGLSSPDSLGAYLSWAPRIGRMDAERNCVSNIRNGGLEPVLAAKQIATLMNAARDQELTGVNLKISTLLS